MTSSARRLVSVRRCFESPAAPRPGSTLIVVLACLMPVLWSCSRAPASPHGLYIARLGSHLVTMELRDSNRGVLKPDASLTYAVQGDTLLVQADPRRDRPPSLPSRFLIIRDTLRELNTSTPLVFVRQHD